MGLSQSDAKERNAAEAAKSAPPVEEQRPPVGPPAGSIGRMILTWRIVLSVLLAVAVVEAGASVYQSARSRWPSTPASVITKSQTVVGKLNSYLLDLRYHAAGILQSDREAPPRGLRIHDRIILAVAVLVLVVRLLMESKLIGDSLAAAGDARWVGCKIYTFQVVATIGLAGLLAWLGALVKVNVQMPLLWLFVAFLAAHALWMGLNFVFLGGREVEANGRFLGLAVNSLVFAAVLIAGSFFTEHFRDKITLITATSMASLVSSVIGLRIVGDSFMGAERPRAALRHAAFIAASAAVLVFLCVTLLARQ